MSPRLREVLKSIEQHYDAKAWRHVKASMLNVRRAAESGTAPESDAVRTVGAVVDCVVAELLEEEMRDDVSDMGVIEKMMCVLAAERQRGLPRV